MTAFLFGDTGSGFHDSRGATWIDYRRMYNAPCDEDLSERHRMYDPFEDRRNMESLRNAAIENTEARRRAQLSWEEIEIKRLKERVQTLEKYIADNEM